MPRLQILRAAEDLRRYASQQVKAKIPAPLTELMEIVKIKELVIREPPEILEGDA